MSGNTNNHDLEAAALQWSPPWSFRIPLASDHPRTKPLKKRKLNLHELPEPLRRRCDEYNLLATFAGSSFTRTLHRDDSQMDATAKSTDDFRSSVCQRWDKMLEQMDNELREFKDVIHRSGQSYENGDLLCESRRRDW